MDSTRKNPSGTERKGFVMPDQTNSPKVSIRIFKPDAFSTHIKRALSGPPPMPVERSAFIAELILRASRLPRPMFLIQWQNMTVNERMFYLQHHALCVRDGHVIIGDHPYIEFDRLAKAGERMRMDSRGNRLL
jgi:hypothetical protein